MVNKINTFKKIFEIFKKKKRSFICSKSDMESVYNMILEQEKIKEEAQKKIDEIQSKILNSDFYLFDSAVYCEMLEYLRD